ncbi:helix-turn-helix domain-containing protein [Streptomyces sp. NPDC057302]|uniref:helix-turn-helix domain-containing protein n=1 Tax=Streptomyces sp. NPDC057302 TaxID=3346094 RepID=UPI00363BC11C
MTSPEANRTGGERQVIATPEPDRGRKHLYPVRAGDRLSIPIAPDTWLTAKDVAGLLGVSQKTLQKWRTARKGPRFHRLGAVGGRVRYAPADVSAFQEETQVTVVSAGSGRDESPSTRRLKRPRS